MATKKKPAAGIQTVVPKANGRPDTFTQQVFDEVIARLSMGEPLAAICRDAHMPGLRTFYDWKDRSPELAARFAHARDDGFDQIALETLTIADTPVEAIVEKSTAHGLEVTRQDALGHRKLQIETRLKLLAKWDPRRYGDKIAIGGADDLPALRSDVAMTLDPSEAYKRLLGGAS
jgi:hypothetical protein